MGQYSERWGRELTTGLIKPLMIGIWQTTNEIIYTNDCDQENT